MACPPPGAVDQPGRAGGLAGLKLLSARRSPGPGRMGRAEAPGPGYRHGDGRTRRLGESEAESTVSSTVTQAQLSQWP